MAVQGFPEGEAPFAHLLSAGVGYGVVIGASVFFAAFMCEFQRSQSSLRLPVNLLLLSSL